MYMFFFAICFVCFIYAYDIFLCILSGLRPGAADPFLGAEGQRARNSVQKTFNKGGIFGDTPCESINRKLRPLSVPFVPPIKMRHLNPVRKGFGTALARPTPRLGLGWTEVSWAGLLGRRSWAGSWPGLGRAYPPKRGAPNKEPK